ncbi:hypothetical protein Taro_020963 [Colocasia esculenta]|uniref:Major facilitator superfamily (MFS) profile domain-containing protein n=1 Tax=Colocasia esculenta TaxID=4460 RepID=A0A843UXQ4_COLES|nr:hypothetical protein [Colocasia esculenta]
MAGGGFVNPVGGGDYPGKLTWFVMLTCIVAATGGLIFGYDIGISVFRKEKADKSTNQYCKFDSQLLTSFTSSLYLAALVASFFASTITRVFGRKWSMLFGGVTFLAGAAINGTAKDVAMLIIGRILLGVGVGFANQSVPLYLSEMAPARYRGMLNIGFQLMITIGIFVANLINYGTAKIKGGWGWRVSLAGAAVPAAIITLGSLFLPDTPNSLIDRGKEEAREMLRRIRGTNDIDREYQDLVVASNQSRSVQHPWANIIQRKYRPQLTMAILIPFFQQLTGINVIMFYAPILFNTIGFLDNASLIAAVITGAVNIFATLVSVYYADRAGRRKLFLAGGTQMLICQILVGTLIWKEFGTTGHGHVSKGMAIIIVALICVYVSGFAWSWGPLGWLVPSEIFPLEIRSAGQAINVSVNMFFTFVIAQVFLSLLCHFKFGLFYFFGGWVIVMTIFIYFFLPETKNVPIEEMVHVWKAHWFWGKYINDATSAATSSSRSNP